MGETDYTDLSLLEMQELFEDPNVIGAEKIKILEELQKRADRYYQKNYPAFKSNYCVRCNKAVIFAETEHAFIEGHIYSLAGQRDFRMNKLCEYCFDLIHEPHTD